MIGFNIKTNFPDIHRQLNNLHEDIRKKALPSSLNRTLDQSRTAMTREITREYALPAAKVRERLRVERASAKQGEFAIAAALNGTGKRSANLIHFVERVVSLSQARTRMRKGEGGTYKLGNATVQKRLELRFKILRSGPKKVIAGAFVGNKGRTVFIRTGDKRLPIRALSTVDVPSMFNQKRINGTVRAVMLARFPENFARDVAFFTDKFNQAKAGT